MRAMFEASHHRVCYYARVCGREGEREGTHTSRVHVCQIMREEQQPASQQGKHRSGGGEELIISRALSSN